MYEALYDEYAGLLHAYCWSMAGEDASATLRDAFVAAARRGGPRHPVPSHETELWLYGLARTAGLRRMATARFPTVSPLARAAATLRPDQREVLALSGRLEVADVARLVGVAPDTVRQLVQTGRTRLQRSVLDVLLHGPVGYRDEDLVTAFEKGALDTYYAASLPADPGARIRESVLASCAAETAATLQIVIAPPDAGSSPSDPIDLASHRKRSRTARVAAAAGIAVGVAAAAGVFTTLVSASQYNGAAQTGSRHLASSRVSGALPALPVHPAGSASSASPASSSSNRVNRPNPATPPVALPPSITASQPAAPPTHPGSGSGSGDQHQPTPPPYSPTPQPTGSSSSPSATPTPSSSPPTTPSPTPSASGSPTAQPSSSPKPTSAATR